MRFKFRKCMYSFITVTLILCLMSLLKRGAYDNLQSALEEVQHQLPLQRRKDIGLHNNFHPGLGFLSNEKIDWHDYAAIKLDQLRIGPGEQGLAVKLTQKDSDPSAYKDNGFNILVSDRISLNRSLTDIRHPNCKTRLYLSHLPNVSVVIPFHNEGWSTLLRTVHSIINRTPPSLLHEIVLVDDFSDKDHLKSALDQELTKFPKVHLVRASEREGLIRARLIGVKFATGEVIVIFDSHIEASINWLPPLIEPIAIDRKVVTCPMIDVISMDTFRYSTQAGDAMRGAFDWELYYKRIPIPPEKASKDPSDPFEDPVMAGGLFAINRLYFHEIGLYDPGLEIWGGEQYELSFKVWMCGGKILDTPCSRIGHIYRKFMPYRLPKGTSINKNYKRVIEVWMDEYKEHFYKRRSFVRALDAGDLKPQKALREKLHCKSFKWFMTEVAPDIVKYYPPVFPSPAAEGKVRNVGLGMCIDTRRGREGEVVSIGSCDDSGEKHILLTWQEDIRPGEDMINARGVCLDGQGAGRAVILWNCHGQGGNQQWKYHEKRLIHATTSLCAEGVSASTSIVLKTCERSNPNQMWEFDKTNRTKLAEFNKNLGPI